MQARAKGKTVAFVGSCNYTRRHVCRQGGVERFYRLLLWQLVWLTAIPLTLLFWRIYKKAVPLIKPELTLEDCSHYDVTFLKLPVYVTLSKK